jgi:hypothetical protein
MSHLSAKGDVQQVLLTSTEGGRERPDENPE